MEKEKPEEVTFEKLEDAIKFVDEKFNVLQKNAAGYAESFKELTGYKPEDRVTALDVVKIFDRMSAK